ncbi:MAG: hypothetical protein LBQ74_02470 [Prevotella sp.]|jgi:capsular polysaccharide biosynthesis protein|nr:hypothetical protein [Dysgonamonadaceae bacterium]MDR2001872.1 hypothetical protein [Prevotella sp.]
MKKMTSDVQLQKYNRPLLFYGTAVLVPWLCRLIFSTFLVWKEKTFFLDKSHEKTFD